MADRDGPAPARRRDTRNPRRSRRRALKILFQSDARGADPITLLDQVAADDVVRAILDDEADVPAGSHGNAADVPGSAPEPLDQFTRALVTGVHDHQAELDALISRHARGWRVERMPAVDRTVLRLAAFELVHEATSPAVVIDEAVELAKTLSTEDSGRYVNGVLEAIRRSLAADG